MWWHNGKKSPNFVEASQVPTSPILTAETCSSSEKIPWLLRLVYHVPISNMVRLPETLHLPSWPCLQHTIDALQLVSSTAHTRWWRDLEPHGSQYRAPQKILRVSEGLHWRLNTRTLTVNRQLLFSFSVTHVSQSLESTFHMVNNLPNAAHTRHSEEEHHIQRSLRSKMTGIPSSAFYFLGRIT